MSTTHKYESGDKIRVEFDGVYEYDDGAYSWAIVSDPKTGLSHKLWSDGLEQISKKIAPRKPAYWPPQVGDVWRVEVTNTEYAVRENVFDKTTVVVRLTPRIGCDNEFSPRTLDKFAALRPVLVRRRGVRV